MWGYFFLNRVMVERAVTVIVWGKRCALLSSSTWSLTK